MSGNPNLAPCPDCGHICSRMATRCINCGRPLGEYHKRASGAGFLIVVLLLIVLVVAFAVIVNHH